MSITVFLADDHAVVRDGLRFLLEAQHDITVVGDAANGRDAVRQVAQLCPDVVIDPTGVKREGVSITVHIFPPYSVKVPLRQVSRLHHTNCQTFPTDEPPSLW